MSSINLLDTSLMRALMDETIPFHDVMNAFGIRTHIVFNLPASVLGFTYVSRRGNYHLFLNGNVSYRTQVKTFLHEIQHILNDMPKCGYIIGINMEHLELEDEADEASLQLFRYLVKS
ncbi:conserved hypothetical protein [Thermoanaerobacter mathranii subsp. mathranii str. A3]|uniref:IrrE N-terminal-like domain-containing protein n=1 Tax=Thermoanaerobacter mathranii subsp. mathranii (strain DSM 11426 / CCUG 53645 / CIP 108742 / A3) TaxID=583358 RepID=A0ABN3YYJ6_THEM3|nr:hypothetical protein [Thermoanaerobacter mathranii]ADH59837.1 conserved hypothetical protein [Thermoanaerobacter mathranii subsp. mathranii str. A3]